MAMIGKPAPDFTADAFSPEGSFEKVSLSSFKGKWVVLFFWPFDYTGVCGSEVEGFRNRFEEFANLGTVVLGASTDSKFSHKNWVESILGKVPFPMIADFSKKIAADYGILNEEVGHAFRGTFLIDPEGKIRSYLVNDAPIGRSIDETLRTLQALQSGGPTVCEWRPKPKA